MDGAERRWRAYRQDRGGDLVVVRQLRLVQGTVRESRRRPVRQRMGVVAERGWQAVDREYPESGQSADGRQDAYPWSRCLGARVLLEVPEPSSRLHHRVV